MSTMAGKHHGKLRSMMGNMVTYDIRKGTKAMSDNRSFEHWDKYDPVANAIVALVVAQDEVQEAFDEAAQGIESDDGTVATIDEFGDHVTYFLSDDQAYAIVDAKLEARAKAIKDLVAAQREYWRVNGERPPAVRENV